jgi:hypothetical protein
MADLNSYYTVMVVNNNAMVKKFKTYVAASKYDGKKDIKKWRAELEKAILDVRITLGQTQDACREMNKALIKFTERNKEWFNKDQKAQSWLKKVLSVVMDVEKNMGNVQDHLKRHAP